MKNLRLTVALILGVLALGAFFTGMTVSRADSETRPVFCFGKLFEVTAYAGPEFMHTHPMWEGWLALFGGLLLTTALVVVINVIFRRHEKLERLVLERTAALRESKARFDQLAEQSHTVNWEVDTEGFFTYAGHVVKEVLDYAPEELVGKKYFYELFAEAERETLKPKVFQVLKRNKPFHDLEFPLQAKDGRRVDFSMSGIPLLNKDGTLRGYRGTSIDVTGRKQAEEALSESEALQRQLLAVLPAGVVIVDPATRIIERVNEYVATLFGDSIDHLVGRECHSLMCSANRGACPVCDLGKTVDNSERIMLRADGSRLPILKTVKRIQLNGQEKLLECFVDISERKRAEEERERLEIQLRHGQKMESIGRLAAGIAHEINTPLQFVLNNVVFVRDAFLTLDQLHQGYRNLLENLESETASQEQIAEIKNKDTSSDIEFLRSQIPLAFQESLDGVDRVTKIVRAMREFSHPGSHKPTLTNLNQAIAGTLTVCRSEWKRIAEVVTGFDPELPLVPCYSSEINQAVLNIVVNAAQAIGEALEARKNTPADASGDALGTITVTTRRDGNWAEVRISDTGMGIPEQARANIFDPFFTTKEVGKGTGLGLAIAHAIVEQKHGGTITFETETGRGTTFIFRLPLTAKE